MGWIFEYLAEELKEELQRLLMTNEDIELDEETKNRVELGEGKPHEGTYRGSATVGGKKVAFEYSIEAYVNRDGWEPTLDFRVKDVRLIEKIPSVKFDGKIAYICPYCGSEERAVDVVMRWTCSGVSNVENFEVTDDELIWDNDLPEDFDVEDVEEEEYQCPECGKKLKPYHILEGYREWLQKKEGVK
jgi:DNA-directed RNA polymerase subunit RPC12/RpoP